MTFLTIEPNLLPTMPRSRAGFVILPSLSIKGDENGSIHRASGFRRSSNIVSMRSWIVHANRMAFSVHVPWLYHEVTR
jgi:hypothetical protein